MTAASLLLCSCVGPVQTPVVATRTPAPIPPPPPQQSPPPTEWHDMPATVGVWRWGREGSLSIARFGTPAATLLSLACNPRTGTVSLAREDRAGTAVTMAIFTTTLTRTLALRPAGGFATASLAAHDPLLDAMAFSRGRFAVEVPGLAPLYLPSWPEVGRVIEDCRRADGVQ